MEQIKRKNEVDMLHGSLANKIILFALPLAASSILQQLFNSADVAVVGRFAGSEALAAVGANGSVINLFVNFFVGLSIGTNVVLSSYLGQAKHKPAQKTVHTSIILALICGIIMLVIGFFFAEKILIVMSTPADILKPAVKYLRIYLFGMPFILLYNFEAAILRSKGDTEHPLFALLIAGIINVILNLFFVIGFHMSVDGVAIATVLSNVVSSMLLLYVLLHENEPLKLEKTKLHISPQIVLKIAKIGIPSAFQATLYSISNVLIQKAMNGLGSTAIAANAAALNYEYFAYFLLSAFSQACVTFVSQNYAAGNKERCRKIVKYCWMSAALSEIVMNGIFIGFAHPFASVFTKDSAVAELAVIRMIYVLSFEVFNMTPEVLSGCMRGLGYSFIPAIICVLGICGFRIIWIYTIFQRVHTYQRLIIVYPISWIITSVAVFIAYLAVRKRIL